MEKVELSQKALKRNQRFKDFDTFYKNAKTIFGPFKIKGEREEYYEALYNLAICPGSRYGGRESRIVEFFWGNRLFDKNEGVNNEGQLNVKFESESGATAFFFKNDDGYVSIMLYPAKTGQRSPIEDFIIWKHRVKPSHLLDKCFQERCWKAFMAYMEVTSLDGAPTIFQRMHIWYLRNFKQIVIDKKSAPIRFHMFLKNVGTWVLTVGFSGLVIFLLQLWLSPNPAEHQNIQDIKQSVIETKKIIDGIKEDISSIREIQDTLNNSK